MKSINVKFLEQHLNEVEKVLATPSSYGFRSKGAEGMILMLLMDIGRVLVDMAEDGKDEDEDRDPDNEPGSRYDP